jgi:hypothetical protein
MKNKTLSIVLTATLGLMSTNVFADLSTCNNTEMKEAIKNVDKKIVKKTIQLRFNENDIAGMEELNAGAQKVFKTSAALLCASVGSLLGLGAGAFMPEFAYAVAGGPLEVMTTSTAVFMYGAGGAFGVLGSRNAVEVKQPDVSYVKNFTTSANDELSNKRENEEYRIKMMFGFRVKQSTDEFLDDFITANDQKLDAKSEELLAKHRDAGNGILGNEGAAYTATLLAIVEARKELYTLQLNALQKLKVDIANSCSALEAKK